MGSGTISGPRADSFGSLLELTRNGTRPLRLAGDVERAFLEDDDEVVPDRLCAGEGLSRRLRRSARACCRCARSFRVCSHYVRRA